MAITKPTRSMLNTGISDSSDATFLTADSSENATFAGNLTVTGNLTVSGTQTVVSSSTQTIADPLIELNTGAGSNANDLGFVFERGSTGDNACLIWDESADSFAVGTTSATGTSTGNMTFTAGAFTAGSLIVDELTINADTITATDDFIIDAVGDITLDAADNQIFFKDAGTTVGTVSMTSGDLKFISNVSDQDMIFAGTDGGSEVTALTLDMSEAGAATFNSTVTAGAITTTGDLTIPSKIIHAGDTDTYLRFTNADDFRIVVGNSTRAAFNTSKIHFNQEGIDQDFQVEGQGSGNEYLIYADASTSRVGIGTASPSASLHINTSTNSPMIVESTHGDGGYIELQLSDSGGAGSLTGYIGSSEALISGGAAADLAIRAQGKFEVSTGGNSKRMSIFTDGSGQFYGSWSLEDNKKLQLGASADLQLWHDGSDSYISDEGTGHLVFRTGAEFYWADTSGNMRMRLNVGANPELRVGTTNDYSSTIVGYNTHTSDHSIVAESNVGSYTGEVLVASSTYNTANGGYRLIQAQRRGYAVVFTVNDAGNAQNANNSWSGISDERLKINIEDASSQWDDIKALRVRKYQWGHGNTDHTQIGLVSQEVEAAGMPHLIEETLADEYQIKYNPALEGEKVKTMKYSVLYMKAVKALQEAQLRIETLEQRIADDDAVVSALENRIEAIEQRLI